MFIRYLYCYLVVLLPLVASVPARALVISGGGELTNNRFAGGGEAFVGYGYDWSGVGKRDADVRWLTMITPSFFITANHWPPSGGVKFYPDNTTSSPVSRTVVGGWQVIDPNTGAGTDIRIGKLDTPLLPTDNIAIYPILMLSTVEDYIGLQFFIYGAASGTSQAGHYIGQNVIEEVGLSGANGWVVLWSERNSPGVPYEAWGEGGDSGAPSLVAIGDQLALLGAHWGVTVDKYWQTTGTVDSFLPFYIESIQSIIADVTKGNSLEFLTLLYIPEPGTFMAMLVLVFMATRRRG